MFIVKFTKTYTHFIDGTPRWTMQPGDTPTLEREAAKHVVNDLKVAEWVGEGCGCPGIDEETILRHNLLALKGIEDDGTGDEDDVEALQATSPVTKQDGAAFVAAKETGKK